MEYFFEITDSDEILKVKDCLKFNIPNDFIILPTLDETYFVISSNLEFSTYKAARVSRMYYYEKVFNFTKFRYFKLRIKKIKELIINRIEEKKSINDLINFPTLKCNQNGKLLSPAYYEVKGEVFVVINQDDLEDCYYPDQVLIEISSREYFDFVYKSEESIKTKKTDKCFLNLKYIEYKNVKYPIPFALWKSGPEVLRGYFGNIGLKNSKVERTEFGFRFME